MNQFSTDIPRLLESVLSDNPPLGDVNALVRHTHRLALTRLSQLHNSRRLHLQSFPLTLESTAIDCIADLFERDNDGRFVELTDFFSNDRALKLLTNDEIIVHFHSLVFNKLRDGIFRLYRENDPILSKIIRNIKEAVPKYEGTNIVIRLGMPYLCFGRESDAREQLAQIPFEETERLVSRNVHGVGQIRDYLNAASEFLAQSKCYSKMIPMIDFALAVKRSIANYHEMSVSNGSSEDILLNAEMKSLVEIALNQSRESLHDRYVNKNKLTLFEFDRFIAAIKEVVVDTFLLNDSSEQSYEDYLRKQIPGMTSTDYLNMYRTKFEYMVKSTKKAVRDKLKEML